MAARRLQKNPAAEEIPGTPRIRDVRIVSGSEVTGLCSRGSSCVPFKLKDNNDGVGEFDLKKMEENAAKLEKDLIMKELETLDFLEALGSTKKVVKNLKLELQLQQQQPLRCMESPEHLRSQIKEMNHDERCHRSPMRSPDMVFTDDLSMIRSYVESLNMKMVEHKDFLGVASLAEELNSLRLKHDDEGRFITKNVSVNPQCEQVKMVVETNDYKQSNTCLKTAKMRLVAARKLEEAARAAEALAIAEMTILSTKKDEFCLPEPPPRSPLTLKEQMQEDISIEVMRKLEEANEEVRQSQLALETALTRVETANVKQLEAEDAFRQWNIESWKDQKAIRAKRSMKGDDNIPRRSFLSHVSQHKPLDDLPKPMLKRNVSVGSGPNRKQVLNIDEKQLRRKFRFIHHTVPEQTE